LRLKGQDWAQWRKKAARNVSPQIVVTRSTQTVDISGPSGSSDSTHIIVEQKTVGGWTFEEEANGITTEVERNIDTPRSHFASLDDAALLDHDAITHGLTGASGAPVEDIIGN
jgi:hypothetical protein